MQKCILSIMYVSTYNGFIFIVLPQTQFYDSPAVIKTCLLLAFSILSS